MVCVSGSGSFRELRVPKGSGVWCRLRVWGSVSRRGGGGGGAGFLEWLGDWLISTTARVRQVTNLLCPLESTPYGKVRSFGNTEREKEEHMRPFA